MDGTCIHCGQEGNWCSCDDTELPQPFKFVGRTVDGQLSFVPPPHPSFHEEAPAIHFACQLLRRHRHDYTEMYLWRDGKINKRVTLSFALQPEYFI